MSTTPAKLRQGKRAVAPAPRGIQPTATLPPAAADQLPEPGQGSDGRLCAARQRAAGQGRGIVAGAHKLARILWAMIVSGQPYDETKAFDSTPAATVRRRKNLAHQARTLNLKLVPA